MSHAPSTTAAEVRLPTDDLNAEMAFFRGIGFRLDQIFPADDPSVAVMSGHGLRLRLQRGAANGTAHLRLLAEDPQAFDQHQMTSPGGTTVEIARLNPPMEIPPTAHRFMVRRLRDEAPWVIGRAGMHYRDLIPDRLGGSIIASHIRIPDGGPVPDMVHYHTVGFQLIYCYRGWVDVVYEDQGPPMRLTAGDCVIQPPEIRHRVLEASDNVEVVEIGVPAEHVTTIDHEMELPTGRIDRDRVFGGQRFVHHIAKGADWVAWRLPGFEMRETGISEGTQGVASVRVARRTSGEVPAWSHAGDILFTFVLEGELTLAADEEEQRLAPGDAFVVPPGLEVRFGDISDDLELLEVALPGEFETQRSTQALSR